LVDAEEVKASPWFVVAMVRIWHLLLYVRGRLIARLFLGSALACAATSGCTADGLPSESPSALDGASGGHAGDAANAPKDGGPGKPIEGADAGATFPCGLSGELLCSCGNAYWSPAPTNDAGQTQTFGTLPDAGADPYTTVAEFDSLAVGRWRRTAGEGQLHCEQFGIDFTSDHRMIPLAIANDGSIQEVTAQAISFDISFADPNIFPAELIDAGGGFSCGAPQFFDADQVMFLLYDPWPADYVRVN
jgi:hypothetical protein